jgi:serine/threonine protein kinase
MLSRLTSHFCLPFRRDQTRITTDDNTVTKRGFRSAFERDALQAIGPHAHIVKLVAPLDDGYVMEKLRYDCQFMWAIEDRERYALCHQYVWCQQLALAIAHIHSRGYIHGDIKSGNVMFTECFLLKLIDFDVSAYVGEDGSTGLEQDGVLRGTCGWCPPETLRTNFVVYDKKSDIYSMGVTMWEFMTRREACRDLMDDELIRRALAGDHPRCDGPMGKIIDQCCDLDPAARPTAHDIAQQVADILTRYDEACDRLAADRPQAPSPVRLLVVIV